MDNSTVIVGVFSFIGGMLLQIAIFGWWLGRKTAQLDRSIQDIEGVGEEIEKLENSIEAQAKEVRESARRIHERIGKLWDDITARFDAQNHIMFKMNMRYSNPHPDPEIEKLMDEFRKMNVNRRNEQ